MKFTIAPEPLPDSGFHLRTYRCTSKGMAAWDRDRPMSMTNNAYEFETNEIVDIAMFDRAGVQYRSRVAVSTGDDENPRLHFGQVRRETVDPYRDRDIIERAEDECLRLTYAVVDRNLQLDSFRTQRETDRKTIARALLDLESGSARSRKKARRTLRTLVR